MASQVLMPSRAPTQLDALSTALQIGSTLYGIKYQGEKLEQEKQAAIAQKARDEQTSTLLGLQVQKEKDEAATRERLAKGEMSPLEFGKFSKESGYTISKVPTNVKVKVSGKDVYLTQASDLDTQIKQTNLLKSQIELAQLPDKLRREIENQEIEKQYKIAKTLEAANSTNSAEKAAFAKLPTENQEMIKDLAKKNVNLISIQNEIKAALKILTDPALNEDQKIIQGKSLLKTLNSTQGADAIGSEESKRLGSFLEYKIANFREPGSFIGRDLDQFIDQTAIIADKLDGTIELNTGLIDQMRSGKKQSQQQSKLSEFKKVQAIKGNDHGGSLINKANADSTILKKFNPNEPFTPL